MSRMIDYGKTCETCKHRGTVHYTRRQEGQDPYDLWQCLESKWPSWQRLDDCCDKWEGKK